MRRYILAAILTLATFGPAYAQTLVATEGKIVLTLTDKPCWLGEQVPGLLAAYAMVDDVAVVGCWRVTDGARPVHAYWVGGPAGLMVKRYPLEVFDLTQSGAPLDPNSEWNEQA